MIIEISDQISFNSNQDLRFFIANGKRVDSIELKNLSELEEQLKKKVFLMDQVHGTDINIINSGSDNFLKCDGLITEDMDILIGVQTADCVPVLIIEGGKRAVIHSGWKGTLGNIVGKSLEYFNNPKIFIGPCIRSCCYEINTGLNGDGREKLFQSTYGNDSVVKRDNKLFLNLPYVIKKQVSEINSNLRVYDCEICSCCSRLNLPSHFRDGDKRNNILISTI